MAIRKITLTDDMLSLISCIRHVNAPKVLENDNREHIGMEIDFNSLYGGNFVYEDISYIIGKYGEHIPGTEENPTGPEFDHDLLMYMDDMHGYIVDNIGDIEDLVHWFSNKGGLKSGTYEFNTNIGIWKKID